MWRVIGFKAREALEILIKILNATKKIESKFQNDETPNF